MVSCGAGSSAAASDVAKKHAIQATKPMTFCAFIVCFSLSEQVLMIVLLIRDIPHLVAANQGGGADRSSSKWYGPIRRVGLTQINLQESARTGRTRNAKCSYVSCGAGSSAATTEVAKKHATQAPKPMIFCAFIVCFSLSQRLLTIVLLI